MPRTRIKICGVRTREVLEAAVESGCDVMGFVVDVPSSPRTLDIESAAALARMLPRRVLPVAVMRNPTIELVRAWPETWVQLHGDEDGAFIEQAAATKHVIKGFGFDPDAVGRFNGDPHVEMLLIDGPAGGGGTAFDHAALAEMMPRLVKPILIAGGLTAANVAEIILTLQPFAVDVSSGVETSPGEKSPELIRGFCEAVRRED